jgi:hypothetical protein
MSEEKCNTNLPEALAMEIERNRELLEEYKKIPGGVFGAMVISMAINNAVDALASGDVVEMMKAYEAIKDTE